MKSVFHVVSQIIYCIMCHFWQEIGFQFRLQLYRTDNKIKYARQLSDYISNKQEIPGRTNGPLPFDTIKTT
jgi:hypothetical protein